MGYIENNLNPGERILYATHLHWIVLLRSIVVDAIFSGAGHRPACLGRRGQAHRARRGADDRHGWDSP